MREYAYQSPGMSIRQLGSVIASRLRLVVAGAVIGAACMVLYALFAVRPLYTSYVQFYVSNQSAGTIADQRGVTSSDLEASKSLVSTCIVLLRTKSTLYAIVDASGLDYTADELNEAISATSVSNTEVLRVSVSLPSAEDATQMAETVATVLPERVAGIVDGASVEPIDSPQWGGGPSARDVVRSAVTGGIVGAVVIAVAVAVRALVEGRITSADQLALFDERLPVLAEVPPLKAPETGANLTDPASEAYRILQANLAFRLPARKGGRVIGVTSPMPGEGKTVTAINLAHALVDLDKNVLLIDANLRHPSVAERLGVEGSSGLVDALADTDPSVQAAGRTMLGGGISVLAAGDLPSNPTRLLQGPRMRRLVKKCRRQYDYVLLDLPPVNGAADAAIASRLVDGMLVVIRRDLCRWRQLARALDRLVLAKAPVLGFVMTSASGESKGRRHAARGRGARR